MNGRDGAAPTTKAKVLAVLADLGYLPPAAPPRAGLVGLIVPELTIRSSPRLAQAFVARLMEHATSRSCAAWRRGRPRRRSAAAILAEHRVDGLIVVSGRNANLALAEHEAYLDLSGEVLPQLFVNGFVEGLGIDAAVDRRRRRGQGRVARRHLAELGHERIGLIVGPERHQPHRSKGRRVPRRAGRTRSRRHRSPDRRDRLILFEGGSVGAHHLVDAGVTGIVTASDLMALGAIRGS
ncbi:MAG: hypothetical protein R2705_10665 [Ilumatobacteraceae bacterium]